MNKVKVKGNLTPKFLNNKLGPFLQALTELQHTIDEIKQVPPSTITIREITSEEAALPESSVVSWIGESSRESVSWEECKQALEGLRETIDVLSDEPESIALKRATLRWANVRFRLFENILFGHEETENLRRGLIAAYTGSGKASLESHWLNFYSKLEEDVESKTSRLLEAWLRGEK